MAPPQQEQLGVAQRRNPLRTLFSRRNIVGCLVGAATGAGLRLGPLAAVAGFIVGRWAYGHAEQRVPFTSRVHIILLPSAAEAALGAVLYQKFVAEQAGKKTLLGKQHKDTLLVTSVAQRLIKALGEGKGGGYQKHLRSFSWEVAVVDEETMNAFVFPGGKICVYTGLLKLLRRDKDLLAMVMGHEIAHALARHSTEKMGLGLGISVALSIVAAALNGGAPAGGGRGYEARQRQEEERSRHARHMRYSRLVEGGEEEEEEEQQQQHQYPQQHQPHGAAALGATAAASRYGAAAAAPRSGGGTAGAPQLPVWMSQDMVDRLTAILLELPFSRRAETEADLIGLKLMTLAGFDASKGPEAFTLLAQARP
ncbi:peptidase M48, Ste24p [Monoraphidium neglectum]|uniref:Peptidase M48, Ste24p n=1 Tax=Monoraphidium neglectum TaxID=145388 RepID=A0A0D2MY85_9CHLO|nr:peptidase M48, Ste24p [Monoraphidium neglectum]KIZ05322.1 peptidase M48, Ste24p [Monoraphidium neglectum]|eukprot:XP_013904341.1 peptidase M48, Ste24p [Monoraphidium neglectum]